MKNEKRYYRMQSEYTLGTRTVRTSDNGIEQ